MTNPPSKDCGFAKTHNLPGVYVCYSYFDTTSSIQSNYLYARERRGASLICRCWVAEREDRWIISGAGPFRLTR